MNMKSNIIKKNKIMKTKRNVKKNSDVIMVECLNKLLTMLETTFNKRNTIKMVKENKATMVECLDTLLTMLENNIKQ